MYWWFDLVNVYPLYQRRLTIHHFPTNTINPQQQQADRSDTKALVDFVLKCEGEWATAGHAKK